MEKQHGNFLEKCKSDFLAISAKSLELKQEIRRLRMDMALPSSKKQEPKVCYQICLCLILCQDFLLDQNNWDIYMFHRSNRLVVISVVVISSA
jgi:hypothetical protein